MISTPKKRSMLKQTGINIQQVTSLHVLNYKYGEGNSKQTSLFTPGGE